MLSSRVGAASYSLKRSLGVATTTTTTTSTRGFTEKTIPYDRSAFAKRHITPGVGRMTDLEIVSGEGCYVHAANGKKYLDFTCGIGVTSTGHSHPKIVKAAQEQVGKLVHAQVNISWHKPMLDLIEKLIPVMPKGLDTFFFWNSGAEAIEAALKLARHVTKKQNVIVFQGGYHGRTFGTMALTTSKNIYKVGFGPFMPGVHVSPYPYCYQCSIPPSARTSPEQCCMEPLRQLELLFKQQTAPTDTAAILLEPVLGEGGYVVPPPYFLKHVRELCTKYNIMMIADEVQSGFCRTGKWFAVDHFGVQPDILVFAKSIASGFPLSGIASKEEFMKVQPPGSMGGTYAGNAVACAAAIATIDVINEENLLKNINERGEQIRQRLLEMQKKHDVIADIRGLGLMIGVELDGKRYKAGIANAISQECYKQGMLILTNGTFECLRFIPPYIVTEQQVNQALDIFESAVSSVAPMFRI